MTVTHLKIGFTELMVSKVLKMGALDFLFVVAVILIVLWLLGFFVYSVGAIIWLLLVIAIIIILVRLLSGRRI